MNLHCFCHKFTQIYEKFSGFDGLNKTDQHPSASSICKDKFTPPLFIWDLYGLRCIALQLALGDGF